MVSWEAIGSSNEALFSLLARDLEGSWYFHPYLAIVLLMLQVSQQRQNLNFYCYLAVTRQQPFSPPLCIVPEVAAKTDDLNMIQSLLT